jgi:multiple sugar transport system permease protein
VVQLVYTVAFQGQNDLGVAAALSVLVLGVLVLVNVLQIRAFHRPEES